MFKNTTLLALFFGVTSAVPQFATDWQPPHRDIFQVEYPSESGAFLNPALISQVDGQHYGVGMFSSLEGKSGHEFLSISSSVWRELFVGFSFIEAGADLSGNAPSFVNNMYLFSLAWRFDNLPAAFIDRISAGVNFNILHLNLYDLHNFQKSSFDFGIDIKYPVG